MKNNNQAYQTLNQFTINWLEDNWSFFYDKFHEEYSNELKNLLMELKSEEMYTFNWLFMEILSDIFIENKIIIAEVDADEQIYWIFNINGILIKWLYDRTTCDDHFSFVKKVIKTIEITTYE